MFGQVKRFAFYLLGLALSVPGIPMYFVGWFLTDVARACIRYSVSEEGMTPDLKKKLGPQPAAVSDEPSYKIDGGGATFYWDKEAWWKLCQEQNPTVSREQFDYDFDRFAVNRAQRELAFLR